MGGDVLVVTDFGPLPELPGLPAPAPVPGHPNVSKEVETGVDVTSALEAALQAAPPTHPIPGHTANRYDTATTILFPALPGGFTYIVRDTVEIPANKNVRLAAGTPRAVRLRVEDRSKPAIRLGGGEGPGKPPVFRAHHVENLVFHGGGVALEEGARGRTTFLRCAFHGIDDWSIQTEGPGVVGVNILDCEFAESRGGGVRVGHSGCDNWIIGDGSKFVRLGLEGVEIRSPGVHVRDASFETKICEVGDDPHKAGYHAYIRVADSFDSKPAPNEAKPQFEGGSCRISACRFGGEVAKNVHGPPAHCIDLTPDRSNLIRGVQIEQNWFLGWTGGEDEEKNRPENSAQAAIRTHRRAHLCTVNGNYFRAHQYHAVIDDALAEDGSGQPGDFGDPGINSFVGNAVDVGGRLATTRADIFPGGVGAGWTVVPP
jgi:hypothetical protein